ncbi:MAG: c-type cytochrome biogenesis protein CcmI [Betaproteobacteria bacterium]|nr:c-type cytochrome biogenesis protein CcmI [Betaproteobacteria bacterium]
MAGFLAVALVLTVLACLWLFLPLFKSRSGKDGTLERDQTNLQVLRNQWEELENDHRAGVIGDAELAEAKAELERRTLEEMAFQKNAAAAQPAPRQKPAVIWGVVGSLVLLIVAGVLYGVVGTPTAFDPKVAVSEEAADKGGHDVSPAQLDEMINAFAAKMESDPNNIEGWMMLARSYVQTGKYQQAAATYEKIIGRIPDEANVLADYADLMATMQGGRLDGRPMELVERALKADPTHWKALALAGTHAFDQQDYAKAEAYWTKMKATVPPESDLAKTIDDSIAEARARAGKQNEKPKPSTGKPASGVVSSTK